MKMRKLAVPAAALIVVAVSSVPAFTFFWFLAGYALGSSAQEEISKVRVVRHMIHLIYRLPKKDVENHARRLLNLEMKIASLEAYLATQGLSSDAVERILQSVRACGKSAIVAGRPIACAVAPQGDGGAFGAGQAGEGSIAIGNAAAFGGAVAVQLDRQDAASVACGPDSWASGGAISIGSGSEAYGSGQLSYFLEGSSDRQIDNRISSYCGGMPEAMKQSVFQRVKAAQ